MTVEEAGVDSNACLIRYDQDWRKGGFGKQERKEEISMAYQVFQARPVSSKSQGFGRSFPRSRQLTACCGIAP